MLWPLATGNLSVTNLLTTTMTCKNINILLELNQHASCNYESIVHEDYHLCLVECEALQKVTSVLTFWKNLPLPSSRQTVETAGSSKTSVTFYQTAKQSPLSPCDSNKSHQFVFTHQCHKSHATCTSTAWYTPEVLGLFTIKGN
jgi:hypothetical protein